MKCFAGIDIGSTAIKIAITGVDGNLVCWGISPTGCQFNKNTAEALEALLKKNSLEMSDIAYTVATGYGRKIYKGADESVSEITANARGAIKAGASHGRIRTIVNIGGQDSKVIVLNDDGNIKNFVMNDKCAAGTGRFLEVVSRILEVEIDELGRLHFEGGVFPLPVNATCTVFAESELITLLSNGHSRPEIISGVHYSIAKRIARLAARAGIEDLILFDGGPAMNEGMAAALEDELMRKVVVPEHPQITTAIGASLIALENHSLQGNANV